MESETKKVVRENVVALLAHRAGIPVERIGVSKVIGLGLPNGTAQRVLSGTEEVRVEVIGRLAEALGIEAWQLLVPGLSPSALPTLSGATKPWPFEMVDERRYLSLSEKGRAFVQAKMEAAIEQQELRDNGSGKRAA